MSIPDWIDDDDFDDDDFDDDDFDDDFDDEDDPPGFLQSTTSSLSTPTRRQ